MERVVGRGKEERSEKVERMKGERKREKVMGRIRRGVKEGRTRGGRRG